MSGDIPPPTQMPPAEYYREIENFREFCRDHLVIITKTGEQKPFLLNSSQRIVLKIILGLVAAGIPPRLIILKARQVGISTLIEAYLFWRCVIFPNHSALVIAHKKESSKSLFRMSRNYHRYLKGTLKQETRIQNVHEIEFDSGSRLQIEVQGDPRGYTAQGLHLSEFAYYLNARETLTAVMQTVPNTVDSFAAIESTANGFGGIGKEFHDMWVFAMGLTADAEIPEDEKGWTPIFIPWTQHEEYEIPLAGKRIRLTADEEQLVREHPEITLEKIKWRRRCIRVNCKGDEAVFNQEYPLTWEEAFLQSGRPAFDTKSIKHYTDTLTAYQLAGKMPPTQEIETEPPGIGVPNIVIHERGRLRIFFPPEDRHSYIVGADPSEGDPGSDASPLAVLDQQTLDCAATWYGRTPPDLLACHAIDLARHFNNGLIIGESNNHGILFNSTLVENGYPNVYYRQTSEESVAGEVTDKPGWLSTRKARENLFDTLRVFVRLQKGRILCPHMVQQIQTLVYVDDKVQAGVGMEKDLLVAFGLCLMAHRGTMSNPLVAHPVEAIQRVAAAVAILKERRGPEAADQFILAETGMTGDEYEARLDAIVANEKREKLYGSGGMR